MAIGMCAQRSLHLHLSELHRSYHGGSRLSQFVIVIVLLAALCHLCFIGWCIHVCCFLLTVQAQAHSTIHIKIFALHTQNTYFITHSFLFSPDISSLSFSLFLSPLCHSLHIFIIIFHCMHFSIWMLYTQTLTIQNCNDFAGFTKINRMKNCLQTSYSRNCLPL